MRCPYKCNKINQQMHAEDVNQVQFIEQRTQTVLRSNKATFVKTSLQVDYECFASCFEKRYIWVAANCGSLLVDTQILLLPANDLWSKDNGSLVNQAVSDG